MRKILLAGMLIVAMNAGLICESAYAASYIPDDVTYQNLNGQQLAVKVYTLLPDQDPGSLREADFEYDGYHYSFSDIVKEEQLYNEENQHTETVSVTTGTNHLEEILGRLEPTIEYNDGKANGTLALDHSSIRTEAAGYKSSSYTVTATKNYTGLDRNDSSYIEKTIVKDGRTLSLSNVSWSVESTAPAGDGLVPVSYMAVATYSGTAYSNVATGYITTVNYTGSITSSGVSSIRYTVTYFGTPLESGEQNIGMVILIITGIMLVMAAVLLFFFLLFRKNTVVYEATGKGNEYAKCGKLFISTRKPELKIDRLKIIPEGSIAVEVEERMARRLFGQNLSIRYFDRSYTHTVGKASGAYWFKLELEAEPEADDMTVKEEGTV